MGETSLLLPRLPAYRVEPRHGWGFSIPPRLRRRIIVTTTLILSDATTAWVAIASTTLLFANPCFSGVVAIPTLVLTYMLQGLYKGCGPGPCERLRLRVSGIAYFVVLGCLVNAASGVADHLIPIALCVVLLAVLGYYGETFMRIILIRLRLWGGKQFRRPQHSSRAGSVLHPEPVHLAGPLYSLGNGDCGDDSPRGEVGSELDFPHFSFAWVRS
jgi:hypothetical protein